MKRASTYFLPFTFLLYTAWLIGIPQIDNLLFWFFLFFIPLCLGIIGNEIEKNNNSD